MVTTEMIWLSLTPMMVLAVMAIIGFVTIKISVNTYNLVMETVRELRNIEEIEGKLQSKLPRKMFKSDYFYYKNNSKL